MKQKRFKPFSVARKNMSEGMIAILSNDFSRQVFLKDLEEYRKKGYGKFKRLGK